MTAAHRLSAAFPKPFLLNSSFQGLSKGGVWYVRRKCMLALAHMYFREIIMLSTASFVEHLLTLLRKIVHA